MEILDRLGGHASAALTVLAFGFALMTAVELLIPRGPAVTMRARLMGLLFWILWLPVTGLIFAGFHALWGWLGVRPAIVLPLRFEWLGPVALVAAPLAAAFVSDFFFYWFHRAQHAWFWRFHAVHHSITELTTVNAFHHPAEALFQAVLMMAPASLVLADAGPEVPAMTILLYIQSTLIHSSTRLHLGPLRVLLVDNRFHRIHHSVEPRHFDRNFGAITTLWDRLFGTAHFPAADEWPETGIAEAAQPRTVRQWVDLPWRIRPPAAKAGDGIAAAPYHI